VASVSYRCNSRCATCGVWKKTSYELSVEEWGQVFRHLGSSLVYLTFTGGEPFLRQDFQQIVEVAATHCRPAVITIPTNGLLGDRILAATEAICRAAPDSQVGLNLSLDGVGEDHDRIRGVPGNWQRAMVTWDGLKALQQNQTNLMLSIHTVISQHNIDQFPETSVRLQELQPDSYITEVAEERVELDTIGWQITPAPEIYRPLADRLSSEARRAAAPGLAAVAQSFRAHYYQLAAATLEQQRQIIPCYAGWASAQIAPDGDLWSCCVRAEPVGNLRDVDYDLGRFWVDDYAPMGLLRRSIAAGDCACPMANAAYTNMLLHPPTALGVLLESAGRLVRKGQDR
jgi:MoaA/NifB/PqqE/SkfB family radical SAM enzyme